MVRDAAEEGCTANGQPFWLLVDRMFPPSKPKRWQFTDNKWQFNASGVLRPDVMCVGMLNMSFVRYLRVRASAVAGCALAVLLAGSASATPPPVPVIAEEQPSQPGQLTNGMGSSLEGFVAQLRRSNYLLGDMWGLRHLLSRYGMTLSLLETSEALGNLSGGAQRGFAYDGLTQGVLQLDTQRAFQWYGGTFDVSGLQLHGNNLSAQNLYTLQTASGIEADRATRLWELWYQQKFLEEDRLDVKIGQQSLDQEFMVSQNAGLFVNTMFGWPMLPQGAFF